MITELQLVSMLRINEFMEVYTESLALGQLHVILFLLDNKYTSVSMKSVVGRSVWCCCCPITEPEVTASGTGRT
jgi:hypothetical protein